MTNYLTFTNQEPGSEKREFFSLKRTFFERSEKSLFYVLLLLLAYSSLFYFGLTSVRCGLRYGKLSVFDTIFPTTFRADSNFRTVLNSSLLRDLTRGWLLMNVDTAESGAETGLRDGVARMDSNVSGVLNSSTTRLGVLLML